ncbi:MAG: nucleotidyltransferase domain-containing protein [bacterium]|nr:nucleotidyltransferase domain-containing protein [bacterium]
MRLSEYEKEAITQSVYGHDPDADVYLFGSRVDDTQKGGDIDLLIISKKLGPPDKINLKVDIFKKLEEQKIDILIADSAEADKVKPFVSLALKQGVLL